jgi:hypothetical protein
VMAPTATKSSGTGVSPTAAEIKALERAKAKAARRAMPIRTSASRSKPLAYSDRPTASRAA